MKIEIVDTKGKKVSDHTLEKSVFEVEPNLELIRQYIHIYQTNQRQGTASSKTRAEVRGGGKKPWRQKGTGRARAGSIRSPIWRHGGIAHGPKPRPWSLKMPKKMKQKALISALSLKAQDKEISIIDLPKFSSPSTKKMAKILNDLKFSKKTLLVLEKPDQNVIKSVANIPNAYTVLAKDLNVYKILDCEDLVFVKEAVDYLEKKYKK